MFRIEAEDGGGARSSAGPELVVSMADIDPPEWPEEATLSVIDVGPTSVEVSWPRALDDVGVTAYRLLGVGDEAIILDGALMSAIIQPLTPISEYQLSLIAEDAVGQGSIALTTSFETSDYDRPRWPVNASVEVDGISVDSISLTWPSALGEVAYYNIYVNDILFSAAEWGQEYITVDGLQAETAYNVSVTAIGPTGLTSAGTLLRSVVTLADLPPVWAENVQLMISEQTDTALTLSWPPLESSQDIVEYNIIVEGERVDNLGANQSTYRLQGLTIGTTYQITVEATNDRGRTSTNGPSTQILMTDLTPPIWPADSIIIAEDLTVTKARLSWSIAQDNIGVVNYRIYVNGEIAMVIPADEQQARVESLTPGQLHLFRIEAVDEAGGESTTGPVVEALTRGLDHVPDDDAVRMSLSEHCQECHQPWFTSLDDFREEFMTLVSARVARAVVVPGEPDASLLIEFLEGNAPDSFVYQQMPPDDDFAESNDSYSDLASQGLTQVTTLQIRDWIELLEDSP